MSGNYNNSSSSGALTKWSAVVATGLAGTMAGSLAFVSFVDVRSFLRHVSSDGGGGGADVAKRHFEVWWPCGRDWMVPLLGCASAAHLVAWRASGKASWGWAGLALAAIGPYTGVVLMEDIDALRSSTSVEVKAATERFCRLHHVRLVLAAAAFVTSLLGLADLEER